MVIWVPCLRLKLTSSQEKPYPRPGNYDFLVKTAMKFSNSQITKFVKTNTNRIPIPFTFMCTSLRCQSIDSTRPVHIAVDCNAFVMQCICNAVVMHFR